MKLRKSSILFVSVAVMLLSSMAVSADKTESDLTGDVWHYEWADGIFVGWEPVSRPDIDITELSYTVSGDRVTLTLKVLGTITNSELISFWFSLNTIDSSYTVMWINGELLSGIGTDTGEGSHIDMDPEISVNGGTLSATFDVVGTFTGDELTGHAQEFTKAGDVTAGHWQDLVPDDDPSDGQGDDGNGDDGGDKPPTGTPGFELMAVIGAIAVALIILRKRK